MAVPTKQDSAHLDTITAGCLVCQSTFVMKLSKANYYEGTCSCGQRWQTPKDPRTYKLKPRKEI